MGRQTTLPLNVRRLGYLRKISKLASEMIYSLVSPPEILQ